jgi:hypothetical protein
MPVIESWVNASRGQAMTQGTSSHVRHVTDVIKTSSARTVRMWLR